MQTNRKDHDKRQNLINVAQSRIVNSHQKMKLAVPTQSEIVGKAFVHATDCAQTGSAEIKAKASSIHKAPPHPHSKVDI